MTEERQTRYLLEDSASDGNVRGEGALLVNVLLLDGSLRGLEAEADLLIEACLILLLLANGLLGVEEDALLLLERSFSLHRVMLEASLTWISVIIREIVMSLMLSSDLQLRNYTVFL